MHVSPLWTFMHISLLWRTKNGGNKKYICALFIYVFCMRLLIIIAAMSVAVLASAQPTPQSTSLPPLPVTQVGSKTVWNIFTIL